MEREQSRKRSSFLTEDWERAPQWGVKVQEKLPRGRRSEKRFHGKKFHLNSIPKPLTLEIRESESPISNWPMSSAHTDQNSKALQALKPNWHSNHRKLAATRRLNPTRPEWLLKHKYQHFHRIWATSRVSVFCPECNPKLASTWWNSKISTCMGQ